jgi:hypothetical protein
MSTFRTPINLPIKHGPDRPPRTVKLSDSEFRMAKHLRDTGFLRALGGLSPGELSKLLEAVSTLTVSTAEEGVCDQNN